MDRYATVDGVMFLSTSESYGLPLVEAMACGLPVVCPDLEYARTICGDVAIYFDPNDVASLRAAVTELHRRLAAGWSPDWSLQEWIGFRTTGATWPHASCSYWKPARLVVRDR